MARPEEAVAIALVYETRERGAHVRDALAALGASIVYETSTRALDRGALERSAANVVVVNLGAQSDPDLDEVYGLLGDSRYRVVFNDGDVSSALSGWDQARWTRHLAAKIFPDAGDLDPPRPADAEAVPARKPAHVLPIDATPVVDIGDAFADRRASEDLETGPIDATAPPIDAASHDAASHDAAIADAVFLLQSSEWDTHTETATPLPESASAQPHPTPADGFSALDLDELLDFPHKEPGADTTRDAVPATMGEGDEPSVGAPRVTDDPAPVADFDLAEIEDLLSGYDAAPAADTPREVIADDVSVADFSVDEFAFDEHESAPAAERPGSFAHDDVGDASPAPTPAAVSVPTGDGFELLFDDDDDDTPAAAPAPAAVPADEPATPKVAVPSQWSLEDMVGDLDAPPPAPTTGRADFGIEKLSAAEFLAPPTAEDARVDAEPESELSFELMPIEEAVAPVSVETPARESWLGDAPVKAKVRRVWVLAASIGGPEAVREFLGEFPRDYPALFVLAQHLGGEFVDMMTRQLAKATPLMVRTPAHGDRVSHGEILVVPAAQRLFIDGEGVVVLERAEEQAGYGPSIDRVMGDIADRFGSGAGAIVFSGMSEDAVEGSRRIVAAGGRVYAQTPETCVVSSMVDAVCESGMVAYIGSPKELAEKLLSEKAS